MTWIRKLENSDFEGFANAQPLKQGAFRFEIPPDQPARAFIDYDEPLGRRYDSKDQERVLQARRNGLTLSVLKNYTNWEALRDAARACWLQIFRDIRAGEC